MYIKPDDGQKMPRLWRASEKILAGGIGFKATFDGKKCTDLKGLDAPQQISKGWRIARGIIRATGIVPLAALITRSIYRKIFGVNQVAQTFERNFQCELGLAAAKGFLESKFPKMPSGTYLIRSPKNEMEMWAVMKEVMALQEQGAGVHLVLVKRKDERLYTEGSEQLNPIILAEKNTGGSYEVTKFNSNIVPKMPRFEIHGLRPVAVQRALLAKDKGFFQPNGHYLIRSPENKDEMDALIEEVRDLQRQGKSVHVVLLKEDGKELPRFATPSFDIGFEPTILEQVEGSFKPIKINRAAVPMVDDDLIPLNFAKVRGTNYQSDQDGCLDFVIEGDGWRAVADGTEHNKPGKVAKYQEVWGDVKAHINANMEWAFNEAKNIEEFKNNIQTLMKDVGRKIEDQFGTTFSFVTVVSFQGEKYLVASTVGDTPILLVDTEYGSVTPMPSKNEDANSGNITTSCVKVKKGQMVFCVSDGLMKPPKSEIEKGVKEKDYENKGFPRRLLGLCKKKFTPEQVLEQLKSDMMDMTVAENREFVQRHGIESHNYGDDYSGVGFVIP